MGDDTRVQDRSSLHRYRTEIPNIIDDMDLSVYAFRLYVRLKRVAGDNGKCFYSTRELAEQCKMGAGSVSRAKQELVDKELIRIDSQGNSERDIITIVDLWPANFAHFARETDPACSPQEHPCSHGEHSVPRGNTPVPTGNTPVPTGNTIYKEKEEPLKEEPPKKELGEEKAPTPQQAMYGAVCEAMGWDRKVIDEDDQVKVAQAVKKMYEVGYRADDIQRFMTDVWFTGWQWDKDRARPTLKQIRQEIGKLRAGTPEPVPKASTAPRGFPQSNAEHNRQAVANVFNRLRAQQGTNDHGST